jgi:hypothetical protein
MVLPQDEVYRTVLPLNEVGSVLQNGVFNFFLPQNGVFDSAVLSQIEINKKVLHQSNIVTVNCQLFNSMKNAVNFMLNIVDEIINILTLAGTHGGERLAWAFRILLKCLQHILKVYAWSLSENQASVQLNAGLLDLF